MVSFLQSIESFLQSIESFLQSMVSFFQSIESFLQSFLQGEMIEEMFELYWVSTLYWWFSSVRLYSSKSYLVL